MHEDEVAEVKAWAARYFGVGSPLYRANVDYARRVCPSCGGPLEPEGTIRRCRHCRRSWFAQFHYADGRAKPGSYISAFTDP